ncbi:homeobox protein engrailed-2b, partial [Odontomachus brunneus]|uniref:homeobox protein engrailed-2b n=1 Tax=Odontomachus brunneus TaxID=486640 RepID=UPI0013F1B7C7
YAGIRACRQWDRYIRPVNRCVSPPCEQRDSHRACNYASNLDFGRKEETPREKRATIPDNPGCTREHACDCAERATAAAGTFDSIANLQEVEREQAVRQNARRKRRRPSTELAAEHDHCNREINEKSAPRHRGEKSEEVGDRVALDGETCPNTSDAARQRNNNYVQRTDLTWLQYTRYRPPKLPRRSYVEKRRKRRAGDHPRIPFSSAQLQVLEDRYRRGAYLSRNDVIEISAILRLPQSKVKIWFQNRRARQRRESLNSTVVT